MIAPARDTTADVIMRSVRPSESFLRSDHRQNAPIAATMAAIVTGTNSRRSSLAGIRLALQSNPGGHVFAGIGFEAVNEREAPLAVIARRTLKEFRARHRHAEGPIRSWFAIASKAQWANPAEIKQQFGGTVDFLGDNRVIFDLGGNKHRLIVHISFAFGRVLVTFIGAHAEYDRIDPETVSWRKK